MKQRRILLKGVGLSLPAVWAPPVIQFVSLPAHAQTSVELAGQDECPTLTIPGFTLTCPVTDGNNTSTQYRVDDSTGCPSLNATEDFDSTPPVDVIQVWISRSTFNGGSYSLQVSSSSDDAAMNQSCGPSGGQTGSTGPQTIFFEASSGATWQAEFSINVAPTDPATLTLSDVNLAPV